MRRPSDQVLDGLKAMADLADAQLSSGKLDGIPKQSRRDLLAGIRWAWRMSEVRQLRADTRERRAALPLGAPWNPELRLVPYAPAIRRRKP